EMDGCRRLGLDPPEPCRRAMTDHTTIGPEAGGPQALVRADGPRAVHVHACKDGAKLAARHHALDAILGHTAGCQLRSVNDAILAPRQLEPFHRCSLADLSTPAFSL